METNSVHNVLDLDFLDDISSRMAAAADPLDQALARIVDFVSAVIKCDSCFVYVLEGEELVLRASKNPHEDSLGRRKLRVGPGITGWVSEHREPVAIAANAAKDVRFKTFNELSEDSYQSFLSVPVMTRGRVVGIINLQHRQPQPPDFHHRISGGCRN
ncbi:MAG TPA: GAF domain-containing protein [Terriglobales bacterium]|nr:GAF domain-containing protein [Terriglobales bacterium]